jgi:hypothetical protein
MSDGLLGTGLQGLQSPEGEFHCSSRAADEHTDDEHPGADDQSTRYAYQKIDLVIPVVPVTRGLPQAARLFT